MYLISSNPQPLALKSFCMCHHPLHPNLSKVLSATWELNCVICFKFLRENLIGVVHLLEAWDINQRSGQPLENQSWLAVHFLSRQLEAGSRREGSVEVSSWKMKRLPGWLSSTESTNNAGVVGDEGSIPGSGRSFGGGNGNPLKYSCWENPIDRRAG